MFRINLSMKLKNIILILQNNDDTEQIEKKNLFSFSKC